MFPSLTHKNFRCSFSLMYYIWHNFLVHQRKDSSHANQSSVCQVYMYMFDLL